MYEAKVQCEKVEIGPYVNGVEVRLYFIKEDNLQEVVDSWHLNMALDPWETVGEYSRQDMLSDLADVVLEEYDGKEILAMINQEVLNEAVGEMINDMGEVAFIDQFIREETINDLLDERIREKENEEKGVQGD